MSTVLSARVRSVVHRTRGSTHGPVTRLMSPLDLGKHLKPFVFLDLVHFRPGGANQNFGMHPHSGIATVTFMEEGDIRYEDTTGESGVLPAGGVEVMVAGGGVWHTGTPIGEKMGRGFQLWVALPATQENQPAYSQYLAPSQVSEVGPVRVLVGEYGGVHSTAELPAGMTYLGVRLRKGERWSYTPPQGHTVAWVALATGRLATDESLEAGELMVFELSNEAIDFVAQEDSSFVLGSAVPHPYDLVLGHYSVHTSKEALARGEAGIQRIGQELQKAGRLS
ncbi:pirin family protein [Pectobacterium versatile]|uniref:pirin family protein n=1 Tax=Pectobacterium versatile TaxID=2488639 RepID=UPI00202D266E|nr:MULTISPECIES: pirin family protein [Pectobacterium]MCL6386574.1 pirin family protein [Pectobacterium carotovorum subsp. carotovorum]